RACDRWRDNLLTALALVEAEIDFGPDQDVSDQLGDVAPVVEQTAREMDAALASGRKGLHLREGVTVAVIGRPNVGKSSLVNLLATRDVAIVTDVPGTTRDVLEVPLELDGVPVLVLDTAGLRDTADPVEAEGVARARRRAAQADIRLLVVDATDPVLPG